MAWYHVGGCDCPIGSCSCDSKPVIPPEIRRRKKFNSFLDEFERLEKEHAELEKKARDSYDKKYSKEYDKHCKDLAKIKKDAEKEAEDIIKAAYQKARNVPNLLGKLKILMTSKVNKTERRHIYRIWSELDEKEFIQWLKDGDF